MSEASVGCHSPGPTKLVIDRPGVTCVTWDTILNGSPRKKLFLGVADTSRINTNPNLCLYLPGQLTQPLRASVPSCVNGNNAWGCWGDSKEPEAFTTEAGREESAQETLASVVMVEGGLKPLEE